jgi:hypothetical protein
VQHQGGAIDLAMGSEVKGVWLQHIRYPAYGVWVEQDPTEDSLFSLQVLGWNRIR